MSKEALAKVVQRAISDAGFRRQLNSDPAGALRGFDLSADELSALRTGNAGRLSSLGIDQRMSKAFAIGGAVGATRMAQSDLSAGSSNMIDDTSGMGSRTVIPNDPDRVITADVDAAGGGTKGTVRAGDDYKFASRTAPEGTAGSARVGDDWKFADRAQGSVAPVEGSPEATAADIAASGGSSAARSINDDPDGFLAANANADLSGSVRSNVNDDPDGFLAANAQADPTGAYGTAFVDDSRDPAYQSVNDDPDGFLAANANADMSGSVTRANVNDDPDGFLAANANADLSGGTRGDGTAFLDESEAYLTRQGYDANAADSVVTDAHDRGDVGGSAVTDAHDRGDADSGYSAPEDGPISS